MVVALYSSPSSPHVGWIEFRDPAFHRSHFACTGAFAIDGEEWAVELEMIEPYRADMLGFFEEIASERTGWDGVKLWESEFSQMHLAVTNDGGGEVIFDVFMRWAPTYDVERKGLLHVRADELIPMADKMRRFLRMEQGHRFRAAP